MTRFLLIRHGAHDYLGRAIPGRKAGVHLNELGRKQADQIAIHLSQLPIDAVYSSPMERARETAAPLARERGVAVQIADDFNEFDVGEWTDKSFAEVDHDPRSHAFNAFRSGTRAPGGELMSEVQTRVVSKILALRGAHQLVAIFSHGDPIRAALVHFLGMHIDMYARIEIDPAGVSLVELGDDWTRVRFVNASCEGGPMQLPP